MGTTESLSESPPQGAPHDSEPTEKHRVLPAEQGIDSPGVDHDTMGETNMTRSFPHNKSSGSDPTHRRQPYHRPNNRVVQDDAPSPTAAGPSLPDQVLASAVAGTVEFLKVAGGWTLTATGKVVAPPLHITRTVVLPQLWQATVQVLGQATPQRVQDWLRIFQLALVQFMAVLGSTESGSEFRHRLVLVLGDLLDCLSSTATRQVVVDLTASVVSLGQALYTPEMKQLGQQWTIALTRILQVLSSGRVQQALLDGHELWWALCAVWADPQTTAAVAEVTAYLCYALEMEDALLDGAAGHCSQDKKETEPARRTKQKQQQQQRRRQHRGAYQQTTYHDRVLLRNPNTTVEEAILSSLGVSDQPKKDCQVPGFSASLNERVTKGNSGPVCPNDDNDQDSCSANDKDTTTASFDDYQGHYDDPRSNANRSAVHWDERARNDVHVEYLRNQIAQHHSPARTAPIQRHTPPSTSTSSTVVVPDVEDGPTNEDTRSSIHSPTTRGGGRPSRTRKRARTPIDTAPMAEQGPEWVPEPLTNAPSQTATATLLQTPTENDDDTAADYFHRVLHDFLSQKRAQGVDRVLQDQLNASNGPDNAVASFWTRPGRVTTNNTTNNNKEKQPQVTEPVDSIRQQLQALRNELAHKTTTQQQRTAVASSRSSSVSSPKPTTTARALSFVQRHKWWILVGVALWFLLLVTTGFGLACYGFYALVWASPAAGPSPQSFHHHHPEDDVVIRIVRQVVHVDAQGRVLDLNHVEHAPKKPLSDQELDQISHCIAVAVDATTNEDE